MIALKDLDGDPLHGEYVEAWFRRRVRRLSAYWQLADIEGVRREVAMLNECISRGSIAHQYRDSDDEPYIGATGVDFVE